MQIKCGKRRANCYIFQYFQIQISKDLAIFMKYLQLNLSKKGLWKPEDLKDKDFKMPRIFH